MRDPARIRPLLDELEKLWLKHPDMRLGQLIVNVTPAVRDLFFVEDERLLEAIRTWKP